MGVAGDTSVARADPHGIYYTAIGQQQLFFNVLAALDQADYVETALARENRREAREALYADQPFVRESESGARYTVETELEQNQAGYSPGDPTTPGEPALINRQVTLEGADLYTDQLVREFGAESARRNAAAELVQMLCENGFGFDQCDYDKSDKNELQKHIIETRRSAATLLDPLAWATLPYWNGAWAALSSGNNNERTIPNPHPYNVNPLGGTNTLLTDEEFRAGKILWPDIFGFAPVAYSPEIAEWRKFIELEEAGLTPYNEEHHEALLKDMLSGVKKQYGPGESVKYPYQELKFVDSDGTIQLVGLNYSSSFCGNSIPCLDPGNAPDWSIAKEPGMTMTKYMIAVSDMEVAGAGRVNDIAAEATQRIALQLKKIEDEGVLAKTTLQPHSVIAPNFPGISLSNYGELTLNVDTPVAASEASIYGIPNVLGMLATSQQASALEGLDIPGAINLVKRPVSSGASSTPSPGAFLPNTSGQVAGALDLLFNENTTFDDTKGGTSPSANLISPILEFGARHALRVLTAGEWRESTTAGYSCGFTCD